MLVLIRTTPALPPGGKNVIRAVDLETEARLEEPSDQIWEMEAHQALARKLALQRLGDKALYHGAIPDNTYRGAGLVFAFTDLPEEF